MAKSDSIVEELEIKDIVLKTIKENLSIKIEQEKEYLDDRTYLTVSLILGDEVISDHYCSI